MNAINSIFEKYNSLKKEEPNYQDIPLPKKEYCIYFTPRSGSTWLTEMLHSTGVMGYPEEWFNPENIPEMLKETKSSSIDHYINSIRRTKKSTDGTFGFEITFFQMKLIADNIDFLGSFSKRIVPFYLTRSDFVAQAVSLYKAVSTGYFHSTQTYNAKNEVKYNGNEIKKWILHIMQQEWGFEQHFEKSKKKPFRITYEEMTACPESVVGNIYYYVHKKIMPDTMSVKSEYKPISNRLSEKMAKKFREENEEFVRHWSLCRGKTKVW
ncbi:Stf0 family sulfotransferase [Oceanibaculum sp.]|uniref:Stf0 family sulfotransferase n=1 Tax=Oceanibaculum sp. TaxID=1903597 RepID=UPI00258E7518|nr:Stf0 family sulfotransferase [Oceanibaculum sp.]MCH2394345.1 Stf0 family sulfotransferase [Oceanibaculum sp.]